MVLWHVDVRASSVNMLVFHRDATVDRQSLDAEERPDLPYYLVQPGLDPEEMLANVDAGH